MKAVVLAYHNMGYQGVRVLLDAGYEAVTIFTRTDNPGERAFSGSVSRLAISAGTSVYAPDEANHSLWAEYISQLAPDVIFSFYYHHLLSDEILSLAPKGVFNLHGSLLSEHRGHTPLNQVLVNGETETGVTLHCMAKRADAGAIAAQQRIAISSDDVVLTLHHELCQAARHLLEEALPTIKAGGYAELPQQGTGATYFDRCTPEDSFLDWSKPATESYDQVRAISDPWPDTFSYVGTQKLTVWLSRIYTNNIAVQPGIVISVSPLLIACADGAPEIITG